MNVLLGICVVVAQRPLKPLVQVRFLYPLPYESIFAKVCFYMEDDAAVLVLRPALKTGFS